MRAVIIGGGITGVLCARELRLAGVEVTLVEARHIGSGSSSRTAAGIRQQFSTPDTVRGMRYAVRAFRELGLHTADQQPVLQQNGYLFLYQDAKRWAAAQARCAMQRQAGLIEVEDLEGPALRERFDWVSPDLLGGTFCPTDGFLFPAVVYGEGARLARELGAEIVQNARVTAAHHDGQGRLTGVVTAKGLFEGDVFLDATNAWSPRVARTFGAEVLPIDPIKRHLWFLQRGGAMTERSFLDMPLVISPSGVYARPENASSLLMGHAIPMQPEPDFTDDDQDVIHPDCAHNSGVDAAPYAAWASFAEAVPPVAEFAGFSSTTAGFYGTTPDHNPFFGYDRQVSNLIRLVGFSGHGAMFGPFTARVARELVLAGRDLAEVGLEDGPVSLATFRIGRPFAHAEKMVI